MIPTKVLPITYPFSALVGQDPMQRALLLNAINPAIGGVLIRGEKGTAKSTAARALADLMPPPAEQALTLEIRTKSGLEQTNLAYHLPDTPAPFVTIPLGASDDRVVGALDIEAALQKGERHFELGLLGQAHQGILYVDEVNLLADHLVDVLLDAAASGLNIIEREGISLSHPTRFILVGTMNPEEGDLRPQLLDRFGLMVEVSGQVDPVERAEIVRRRLAFETNPQDFQARFHQSEMQLRQQILTARNRLSQTHLSEGMLDLITHICAQSGVDGLRADITMYKTALTLAAWEAHAQVTIEDVRQAAEFVLPHRRRRQPFEEPNFDQQQLEPLMQHYEQAQGEKERQGEGENRDDQEGE